MPDIPMNYFYNLIFFIAGAAVVYFYNKKQLRKWGNKLINSIDNKTKTDSEINESGESDTRVVLPIELTAVADKVQQIVKSLKNKNPSVVTEVKTNGVDLKKTLNDLYIVNELGQNVTSSLNLQETFQHLFSTLNSIMDAAVVELSVYNENAKTFKIFSNSDEQALTYRNHIAEWCFKNNREVFLADAEHDFERYVYEPLKVSDNRLAKSVICFPIINNKIVSGTLCIISFRNNSFSDYHQKIIRLLLGYLSVALQNALTHEELNITKQRAERSEKFMQQFLANMSHEIRTPINAVTGMTRLLLEKNPLKEQVKYLESIRNASDSLLVIINDILDLSKIEAGKIEIEKIDFSIVDLMNNVKEIMQFKAEEKGLNLIVEIDKTLPPVLIGDPTRLVQILINLIGNAIKFTEKGTIGIEVSSKQQAGGRSETSTLVTLNFSISDTGIGMTTEHQQKLFQDYVQASSETARKYGGTGLGLSISKQLVELQGGNIHVKSEQGKGSTFSFSLSFPISSNKTVALREQVVSKEMLQKLKGIRVLLVDDNEYNRIIARETLELKIKNVFVDETFDGILALEKLKNNTYDIIIMDLVMPNMNGLEATLKIRKEFPAPVNQIKILGLSASVVKSEIDKCYAVGMNGFIPKPFKSSEMLSTIYNALFGEKTNSLKEPVINNSSTKENGQLIDLNYLEAFTEGDQERKKRYLDLFVSKKPGLLTTINESLKKNDFDNIRIVAHSMKPQLSSMGVHHAITLIETIEQNCFSNTKIEEIPFLIEKLEGICLKAVDEIKGLGI